VDHRSLNDLTMTYTSVREASATSRVNAPRPQFQLLPRLYAT